MDWTRRRRKTQDKSKFGHAKLEVAIIRSEKFSFKHYKPGVDVMITIFCDFRQFSAIFDNFLRFSTIFGEKIGVFLKNQCYDQNLA
jgi:hypothetical protein